MSLPQPHVLSRGPSLQVFFDGSCPLCEGEIGFYRRCRGAADVEWIDVSAAGPGELPRELSRPQAMARFHVRDAQGHLRCGGEAFTTLWSALPAFRMLGKVCSLPAIAVILEKAYQVFLKFRPAISRWMSRRNAKNPGRTPLRKTTRWPVAPVLLSLLALSPIDAQAGETAYAFSFRSIDGGEVPLVSFAGKAVLVVNTASRCGFTRQYGDLQELWRRYREKGLVVLGVPSNDFGSQEPGTEAEIKIFCEVNFDVDFPLSAKVKVRGPQAHPFYQWAAKTLGSSAKPRWNFHKYLIAPDGRLTDWFSSPTSPLSKRVISAIEAVLPTQG